MSALFTSGLHDEIVKLTAVYGYITAEEVCYLAGDMRKAWNVLEYLRSKGIMGTFSTMVRPTRAYYLPIQTKRIVESSGEVAYVSKFEPSKYNPSTFFHHTKMMKVHLALKNLLKERLKEFLSEPYLKYVKATDKQKICDGEFIFTNKKGEDRKAGIEIELTLKNREARVKRIRALYRYAEKNLNVIFLFYNLPIIKERFIEAVKELKLEKPPIFSMKLAEFLNSPDTVEAEDLENRKVAIFK